MAPVEEREAEANKETPKLLATLSNHLSPVNCVRWSGDGVTLASAR